MSARRIFLLGLLVAIAASAGLVAAGRLDERVGLGSVTEILADFVWDVDRSTLNLTRISDEEENRLGAELAGFLASQPSRDAELADYVSAVGESLMPFIERRGIEYNFYVIESDAVNALALPGGHVAVTTGMLEKLLESEAELAVVLGHEIAHVDRRHCVELYQHIIALDKMGAGTVGFMAEMLRRLVARGYRQYQEVEADEEGLRLAMAAGYDPVVGPRLFERMAGLQGEPTNRSAGSIGEEAVVSIGDLIGAYGRSHPPSRERTERLRGWTFRYRRQIGGTRFYVGKVNFELRVPRSAEPIDDEYVQR